METSNSSPFVCILLSVILCGCSANRRFLLDDDEEYYSPMVFDPIFYINDNPDLTRTGIVTEARAKSHWVRTGLAEGRQGCGDFHSQQYIARYPDLQAAFGHDYKAAIHHFITLGHTENRIGYVEGGYGTGSKKRWTISNGQIFISASARMGAGIDSLVWKHRQFVNSQDHGRELQMACNSNTYVECYNPTECGGRDDGYSETTNTQIVNVSAHAQLLQTKVHPAFWLRPGTHETQGTGHCGAGSPALNTRSTCQYPFQKKVTIGCAGVANCVEYVSMFTIGGDWPRDLEYIQMEAPTCYMPGEFTRVWTYNTHTHQMENHHGNSMPVAMGTQDGAFIMGVYAPPGQDTDAAQYYGTMTSFGIRSYAGNTTKWNVVFRKRRPTQPTTFTYKTYICVGDLHTVTDCMRRVVQQYPRA